MEYKFLKIPHSMVYACTSRSFLYFSAGVLYKYTKMDHDEGNEYPLNTGKKE